MTERKRDSLATAVIAHCPPTPIRSGTYLSPLPGSVEPPGAATQVAPVSIGTAVDAGVAAGAALIHILAATSALVEVESGRTNTLEAAQSVVAGGGATHRSSLTLVFICEAER